MGETVPVTNLKIRESIGTEESGAEREVFPRSASVEEYVPLVDRKFKGLIVRRFYAFSPSESAENFTHLPLQSTNFRRNDAWKRNLLIFGRAGAGQCGVWS